MELKTIKEFAHKNNLGNGLLYSDGLFKVDFSNIDNLINIINLALNSVYKVKGSATVSSINSMSTGNAMIGNVYNISEAGTITNGIGGEFTVVIGDNVVYTDSGWDKFAASIDLNQCAGDAINIEANIVNVKVAPEKNFLEINDQNELVVDDVTTNKTLTNEDITIEGGPLATEEVKKVFTNGKILAGTDIQAVLKALFCKEIYPTVSANTPTYTVTVNNPTVTADVSNNDLVEVGQTVVFNTITGTKEVIKTTPSRLSGFTYGYSNTIDSDIVLSDNITRSWTINQVSGEVFTLSGSTSGFKDTYSNSISNSDYAKCLLSEVSLTALSGVNTYTVTYTGPKYLGTYNEINPVYIISNLNGRSDDYKSTKVEAGSLEVTPQEKTTTFTVTGVYPIYTNGVVASTNDAEGASMSNLETPISGDGTKLPLVKLGNEFAISFANQSLEPYKIFIQANQTIKSAKAIDPTARTYTTDCTSDFKLSGTTTRKVQDIDITYDVYEWAATEGPNRVKFILN